MKKSVKLIILIPITIIMLSSPLLSQNLRAGLDISAGYSHLPTIDAPDDSFTFVYSGGEKYNVMGMTKGTVGKYGIGLTFKMGYQRHFCVIQPEVRFMEQMYLINTDAVSFWSVSDSVKFGVSRTDLSLKLLYEYKFMIKSQAFSWNVGINYLFATINITEKSTRRGRGNITESEVPYNGLSYKFPELFYQSPHAFAVLGFNWDMTSSISIGGFGDLRINSFEKNNPWFFYGARINYTMPLNKNKKHIYIHKA